MEGIGRRSEFPRATAVGYYKVVDSKMVITLVQLMYSNLQKSELLIKMLSIISMGGGREAWSLSVLDCIRQLSPARHHDPLIYTACGPVILPK